LARKLKIYPKIVGRSPTTPKSKSYLDLSLEIVEPSKFKKPYKKLSKKNN